MRAGLSTFAAQRATNQLIYAGQRRAQDVAITIVEEAVPGLLADALIEGEGIVLTTDGDDLIVSSDDSAALALWSMGW